MEFIEDGSFHTHPRPNLYSLSLSPSLYGSLAVSGRDLQGEQAGRSVDSSFAPFKVVIICTPTHTHNCIVLSAQPCPTGAKCAQLSAAACVWYVYYLTCSTKIYPQLMIGIPNLSAVHRIVSFVCMCVCGAELASDVPVFGLYTQYTNK